MDAGRYMLGALFLAGCSTPTGTSQRAQEESAFRLEPVIWLPSVTGDTPGASDSPIDVNLIGVEDIEFAILLGLEVDYPDPQWSLLIDSVYVRFDDDEGLLRTELDIGMFEVAGARPTSAGSPVELIAGLRYWGLDVNSHIASVAGVDRDEAWVDPIVGARGTHEISENWSVHGRGDIGGFGLEADWTVQMLLKAQYRLSSGAHLVLGYRHLFLDFDDFDLAVTLTGPLIAFGWSF